MPRTPQATSALAAMLTTGLVAGLVVASPVARAATTARPASTQPLGSTASKGVTTGTTGDHTVTLITGDVVTLTDVGGGRSTVTIDPAAGSVGAVRSETVGHDLYVYPDSVLPYLAADRIDRRLFDVTQLVADGYDDASTHTLPLIVEYQKDVSVRSVGAPKGSTRSSMLKSIDGAALSARKAQADAFWRSITPTHVVPARPTFDAGIAKIYLDGKVQADLAESVAQIGAPQAWSAGYDGTGTTVAVLDSGVDAEHPDLVGQVTDSASFVPGEAVADYNGHGTHVASTIAGTGAASAGVEKGVAPGAHLVIGKVLGNDGFGQESWIIDGMQWGATHADVVSMSLGSSDPSDGTDPMAEAVNNLTDQTGALFVIAAGNYGAPGTVTSPGTADDALTVGAVDNTDALAWFSSMGPRYGDSALKPDLVAPGVDISAARSQYVDGTGYYQTMSGTSMATPHVAGAAAILAERHPGWSAQEIKDTLMSTVVPVDGWSPYEVGTGRVDVEAATLGSVHATGSRFFGFLPWPNAGLDPIDRVITYTNSGDDPVTIDLTADFRDASGNSAPDGLLTMSAAQVTVAAHDTQTVTVTADPELAPAGTRYAGTVVGSIAGQPVTRTSIGMDKESERYNLTLQATGRDGQPAQTYVTVHATDDSYLDWVLVDGERTIRLPKGTYSAMTFMAVSDSADSAGYALLGDPQLQMDQDRVVALDATQAVPVTATVDRPSEATFRSMEYYTSEGVGMDESLIMPVLVDTMYAAPTDKVTGADFEFVSRWRLRTPLMQVTAGGQTLDVTQMAASGWLDGTSTLKAVYAGSGSPADYAGRVVKGKAVVIKRSPDVTAYDAARVAKQKGAAFLLVVNNEPGEFIDYTGGPLGEQVDLPVAAVSGLEGQPVIHQVRHGGLTITTSGNMNSPWVYDLVDAHDGAIPNDLSYTPQQSDLAKIKTSYYSNKPRVGGEFRWDFRPQNQYSMGFLQYIDLPTVRNEWVSVQPGTRWQQNTYVLHGQWDLRGDMETYQPFESTTQKWFDPVIFPRLGPGYWGPVRQNNFFQINLPSFGDSGRNHTGGMNTALTHQQIKLYDGDTLIKKSSGWQSLSAEVSPDLTKYRVTSDVTRSAKAWGTSTRVHSEYEFWSEYVADPGDHDPLLPFVQMNFDVDTDMRGDVKAGAEETIGFTAWQLPNVSWAGHIAGGKLEVSYDGGNSWKRVDLTGPVGNWKATLSYPDQASRYVSLRATAWDDAGNRASQEIIRAYGLR